MLVQDIYALLHKNYGINPEIIKGERIVHVNENYFDFGYDKSEVTLGQRYTKYLNEDTILRTQTSSVISNLLKNRNQQNDRLWLCPGIAY